MQGLNFVGSVPSELITGVFRLCKPQSWKEIYVACSGTFRTERMLFKAFPQAQLTVRSNDVSLYTCSLAALAQGTELDFTFHSDLDFVNELDLPSYRHRVAAILVARNMGAYATGKTNRYKERQYNHYRSNFVDMVNWTAEKLEALAPACPISSFHPRDWAEHVDEAIARGAGIIAYPPTVTAGYEKMYAFLAANVSWEEPSYKIFNPKDLGAVVQRIHESGVPYFVYADQKLDGLTHIIERQAKGSHTVYGYGRSDKTGWTTPKFGGEPFLYRPLDVAKIHKRSKLTVIKSNAARLNFLKNTYLKKSIMHGSGDDHFLVYLDDMLAGGIVYRRGNGTVDDQHKLDLLADFSTSRDGRVAKLIARAATNIALVRHINRKYVMRFTELRTMAYSDHPVAMKYRGTWELERRVEDDRQGAKFVLTYVSPVKTETLDEAFRWWWQKDGSKQIQKAG